MLVHLRGDVEEQKPDKSYRLLADVTRGVLLFEANASTLLKSVQAELAKVGIEEIRFLGTCDDDIVPRNKRRPIFSARTG